MNKNGDRMSIKFPGAAHDTAGSPLQGRSRLQHIKSSGTSSSSESSMSEDVEPFVDESQNNI